MDSDDHSTLHPIRTLVTGFGPFGSIGDNPSSHLARSCGRHYSLLDVAYSTADLFIEELAPDRFDLLVMLGVASQSSRMRMESLAKNWVGATADVQGVCLGPGPIEMTGPPQSISPIAVTLPPNGCWEPSLDAGEYLCNYLFFRALQHFPGKPVIFIHVPPFEVLSMPVQQAELALMLDRLEREYRPRPFA